MTTNTKSVDLNKFLEVFVNVNKEKLRDWVDSQSRAEFMIFDTDLYVSMNGDERILSIHFGRTPYLIQPEQLEKLIDAIIFSDGRYHSKVLIRIKSHLISRIRVMAIREEFHAASKSFSGLRNKIKHSNVLYV